MKKLAVILILAVALVGCGRESEQIDSDAARLKGDTETLTIAWHQVTEEDGNICELSTSTQVVVERASEELRLALAEHDMDIVVEKLTPEHVEGAECLCNRVLIQGRFVDEWLGADLAKAPCSGCPNRGGCSKSADTGGECGGQTALVYKGKTYEIVPANLIMMAGLIAAADLTGETVSYGGCPGKGACPEECVCGQCGDGCEHHGATAARACGADCPGKTVTCGTACKDNPGSCSGNCAETVAAEAKGSACSGAAGCATKGCKSSDN